MENFKYAVLALIDDQKYLAPIQDSKEEVLESIEAVASFCRNTDKRNMTFELYGGGFVYIPSGVVFSLIPVKFSVSSSGVVNYTTYTLLTPSEL